MQNLLVGHNFNKLLALTMSYHLNQNLAFWTEKLGSESKARIRLRNATIDQVVRELDTQQDRLLYHPQIITIRYTDELHAAHHGKAVGDVVGHYRHKLKDYDARFAAITRQLRRLAVDEKLSQLGTEHYQGAYGNFTTLMSA